MKKFISAGLGGAPINKNDLKELFNDEIWAALEALLSPYNDDTQGIIVSGCVLSANASNFDMTAGIVYLDGEFMRIDAATNQTFTKYIAPATPVDDSRTFADASSQAVTRDKKAELVGSAPGGQYITIANLTAPTLRRLNEFLDFKVGGAVSVVNGWAAFGGSMSIRRQGKLHFLEGVITPSAASSVVFCTALPAGFNLPAFACSGKGKAYAALGTLGAIDTNCDILYLQGVGFIATGDGVSTKPTGAGTDYYSFSLTWISN